MSKLPDATVEMQKPRRPAGGRAHLRRAGGPGAVCWVSGSYAVRASAGTNLAASIVPHPLARE